MLGKEHQTDHQALSVVATKRNKSIYRTKEVVLFISCTETDVVKGQRKSTLIENGFIRTENLIDRGHKSKL